jgi:cyanophycin synthetase
MLDATLDLQGPRHLRLSEAEKVTIYPQIVQSNTLRGCNIYHTATVISLEVDLGALAHLRTSDLGPGFPGRFNRYFPLVQPVLPPSPSDRQVYSDFRSKISSRTGAEIVEALLEAIISIESIVLKAMYFLDRIQFASAFPGVNDQRAVLVWETVDSEMSRLSAETAVAGFAELTQPNGGRSASDSFKQMLLQLAERAEKRRISSSTAVLKTAASQLGVPFEFVTRKQVRLGYGVRQERCFATLAGSTSFSAAKLSLDKRESNRQLTQLALPVPRQIKVADVPEAIAACERLGGPMVVKPVTANQGRGITIGVQTPRDIETAFKRADAEGSGVIVEELVHGNDYRITIVGGKFVAALLCVPPQVQGDGVRTLRRLINELNAEPDRDKLRFSPVTFDDELKEHLGSLGYTLNSVPEPGEVVPVRATGHVSRGGIPIDVTELVHPDNKKVAEETARVVGLEIAGVDFISPDISKSYREVGGRIVEVNSRPGVGMHLWPRGGQSRNMGVEIITHLYPDAASAYVPLVFVAGDRGRGAVVRSVESMLRDKGLTVGLSLKQGAYINGVPLNIPKDKLGQAPNILLRQPSTEVVAATVSLRQIVKRGLRVQNCDAVSLMDFESEKFTDEHLKGLSVLMKANQGRFIVSSQNQLARHALSSVSPSRIILIAADSRDAEVSSHLSNGGAAIVRRWTSDSAELEFALVDAGREVATIQLPNLPRTRSRDLEVAMHAFALVHACKFS